MFSLPTDLSLLTDLPSELPELVERIGGHIPYSEARGLQRFIHGNHHRVKSQEEPR